MANASGLKTAALAPHKSGFVQTGASNARFNSQPIRRSEFFGIPRWAYPSSGSEGYTDARVIVDRNNARRVFDGTGDVATRGVSGRSIRRRKTLERRVSLREQRVKVRKKNRTNFKVKGGYERKARDRGVEER